MNDLQECLYEILCDVQDTCQKYGITFYLVEGNALGAKRHGGFIPWDDDLDIAMTRENYDKFKKCIMKDTKMMNRYFYQDYKTDPEYPIPFAKIRKNGTIYLEEGTKDRNMHQGIYIDVFPIDYLAKGRVNRIMQFYANQLYESLLRKNIPKNKIKRFVVHMIHVLHIEKWCLNFFEKMICNFGRESSYMYSFTMSGDGLKLRQDQILPGRKCKFENGEFLVFNCLEEYLHLRYGDYMQIPSKEQQEKDRHSVYYKL